MIEEFCKKISNDETIWYATNVEIVDYLKALRNLKFSVNKKIVYNPSALTVWIGVDGNPVKVESGRYLTL
jgi:hypothetical protein